MSSCCFLNYYMQKVMKLACNLFLDYFYLLHFSWRWEGGKCRGMLWEVGVCNKRNIISRFFFIFIFFVCFEYKLTTLFKCFQKQLYRLEIKVPASRRLSEATVNCDWRLYQIIKDFKTVISQVS